MATTKTAALKKTPATASTSVAVRKPAAGNLVSIQAAIAQQVADMGSRINPATGNMIRATQDKKIVLPDGTKTEGPLELVIVDFVTAHNFYEGAFDKDAIVPPDCFAIGVNPKSMFPSANVPNKQADNCQDCPQNAWGSKGKGKACNNERLLAVLPPDADANTPMWLLKASKTAITAFDSYVATVKNTFTALPVQMITTVSLDDNSDYPSFRFSNPVPNSAYAEHFARQAEAKEMLTAERDVSGYEKPVAKPASRRATAGARR